MDLYEFIQECMKLNLSSDEALSELGRIMEDERNAWEEKYYEDPYRIEGWAQEDLIDTYRRER